MNLIVTNTPGYVGADLNALIDEALISSLDRRLLAQINSEQNGASESNEFISSLIEWIKKKLGNIHNNEVQSEEKEEALKSTQSIIEVNQSDFEVMIFFKFISIFEIMKQYC